MQFMVTKVYFRFVFDVFKTVGEFPYDNDFGRLCMKICKKGSPHYVNNWPRRRVQCGHYLKLRCGKIAKESAICTM